MSVYHSLIIFILVLLLTTGLTVKAQDSELSSSDVELVIKPNICVAPRGKDSCISSIDVFWQSTKSGNFCLSSNYTNEKTLKCWNNSKQGNYVHKLILTKNLLYWINKQNSTVEIVSSMLKFAALKPHRKHQRRRNRLPWSLSSL